MSFSKNKLLRSFSIYTIGHVLGVASSLLLLPLFTKTLPQNEFGIIAIFWLLKPVLCRILNFGIDVALSIRIYKETHQEFTVSLYNGTLVITILLFTISMIFLVFDSLIAIVLDPSVSFQVFALFLLSQYFAFYVNVIQNVLQFERKDKTNVAFLVFPPIVTALVTYLLISFVLESYVSYIIGMFVSQFIFGVLSIIQLLKRYSIKSFRYQYKTIGNLLRIGAPVVPGILGTVILAMGDRYIIKQLIGLEAVAVYTYGYRYAEFLLISFFQPFQKAFKPEFYKAATNSLAYATKICIKIQNTVLIFIPLILLFIVVPMQDVMILLADQGYNDSYLIFLLSIFGILIFLVSQVYFVILNFKENTLISMIATLFGAMVNVVGNYWAIKRFGIEGAAIVTIISYVFMLLFKELLMHKVLKIKRPKIPKAILGLLLFAVYLLLMFRVESLSINSIKMYLVKIGLLLPTATIYYLIFPEVKIQLKLIYKKAFAQKLNT